MHDAHGFTDETAYTQQSSRRHARGIPLDGESRDERTAEKRRKRERERET